MRYLQNANIKVKYIFLRGLAAEEIVLAIVRQTHLEKFNSFYLLLMQAIVQDVYRYCCPLKHFGTKGSNNIHYCSNTCVTHIYHIITDKVST